MRSSVSSTARSRTTRRRACDLLFLRAGRLGRLPSCALLARGSGDDLYLVFLGLLGFPIASLLAVGHLDLPWFDDAYKRNLAEGRWISRSLSSGVHLRDPLAQPLLRLNGSSQTQLTCRVRAE